MSEGNDNKNPIKDPLNTRNTDTVSMQRVPSASNAAKTIKLKPIVQKSSADVTPLPGTPPPPVGAKTSEITTTAAKFMSTATGPLNKTARPVSPAPISTVQVGESSAPTAAKFMSTATGPLNKTARPVSPAPVAADQVGENAAPTAAKFMSTATGPLNKTARPAAAPAVTTEKLGTATVALKRPVRPSAPSSIAPAPSSTPSASGENTASTIPLTPISATPKTIPGLKLPGKEESKEAAPAPASASTIPLNPAPEAPRGGGLPGLKLPGKEDVKGNPDKTIGLSIPPPGTVPETAVENTQPGESTINLSPQADGQEDTTITLEPVDSTAATIPPPAPEMKPEPKMNIQDESKNKAGKTIDVGEGAVHMENTEEEEEEEVHETDENDVASEPSIIFTVTAVASLVLTVFVIYGLVGQYLNIWEGKSIPVIGYEQAAGK